jgi:hypothetical protein
MGVNGLEKIKIHELAKELGIENKKVIEAAQKART